MARNAIESEFRRSKMAAGSKYLGTSSIIDFVVISRANAHNSSFFNVSDM